MSKKNTKIALASLVLLSASLQAEELTYTALGTGEEIRENILADNTNQAPNDTTPDQNNTKKNGKKPQPKPKTDQDKNNPDTTKKNSTDQKCGSGTCGDH